MILSYSTFEKTAMGSVREDLTHDPDHRSCVSARVCAGRKGQRLGRREGTSSKDARVTSVDATKGQLVDLLVVSGVVHREDLESGERVSIGVKMLVGGLSKGGRRLWAGLELLSGQLDVPRSLDVYSTVGRSRQRLPVAVVDLFPLGMDSEAIGDQGCRVVQNCVSFAEDGKRVVGQSCPRLIVRLIVIMRTCTFAID